ncbi:hypothetical protein FRB95_005866 [Tulasnella sp. JGI-2019a]|nr:hypothetical protein FRB95_005866 [Tulasnella sp. JGI-2019a]
MEVFYGPDKLMNTVDEMYYRPGGLAVSSALAPSPPAAAAGGDYSLLTPRTGMDGWQKGEKPEIQPERSIALLRVRDSHYLTEVGSVGTMQCKEDAFDYPIEVLQKMRPDFTRKGSTRLPTCFGPVQGTPPAVPLPLTAADALARLEDIWFVTLGKRMIHKHSILSSPFGFSNNPLGRCHQSEPMPNIDGLRFCFRCCNIVDTVIASSAAPH